MIIWKLHLPQNHHCHCNKKRASKAKDLFALSFSDITFHSEGVLEMIAYSQGLTFVLSIMTLSFFIYSVNH